MKTSQLFANISHGTQKQSEGGEELNQFRRLEAAEKQTFTYQKNKRRENRKTNKFHAHDETNQCHIGDVVRIGETRPISKTKCWEVVEIVKRGEES